MRGLISFVNDNHMKKYLKEISVYVYYGSSVNNWPNNTLQASVAQSDARPSGNQVVAGSIPAGFGNILCRDWS